MFRDNFVVANATLFNDCDELLHYLLLQKRAFLLFSVRAPTNRFPLVVVIVVVHLELNVLNHRLVNSLLEFSSEGFVHRVL